MLVTADIHRSIARWSIDFQRLSQKRATAADAYGLAEQEFQVTYEFSGNVGSAPVEDDLTIPFTKVTFVADAGNQRDSQLDRPFAKLSFEIVSGPPGIIPYGYVKAWVFDDDFNYEGAVIAVGVHCPVLPDTDTAFLGIVHAAFQGFGAPWDPDGPFDSGGTIDDTGLN